MELKKRNHFLNTAKKYLKNLLIKIGLYYSFKKLNDEKFLHKLKNKIYPQLKITGIAPTPNNLIFELTSQCNLNCKMCFFNTKRMIKCNPDLTLNQIKEVIDKIAPYINKIILTGGEIFVRLDIFEILDYFKKKNILIHLTTNGTLINESNIDRLIKNKNIVHIGISIDGPEKIHNKIRRNPIAFKNAIKAIKLLNSKHLPVNIITVIQNDNLIYLKSVIKLAYDLNIKDVFFEYEKIYTKEDLTDINKLFNITKKDIPINITSTFKRDFSLNNLKFHIHNSIKLASKLGIKLHFYPSDFLNNMEAHYKRTKRKQGIYCCRNLLTGRIDSSGNLIHCFALRKKLGNLINHSFKEIWNFSSNREFRKKLLNNNLLPLCENCLYMDKIK